MKEDQASSTAFTVLQGLVHTARSRGHLDLVTPETAEVCTRILEGSPEGQRRLKQLANPLFRGALPILERLIMPGISLHYALRKRFIEQVTMQAIEQGVTQVVSLGAGFDTLLWRLHLNKHEIQLIEIDHPATSQVKQAALAGAGQQQGSNLHLLPVDLSERALLEVLQGFDGFDASRKTLFICEGVLMYLDIGAVDTLLESLRRLTDHPVRFVFSAVSPMTSAYNNTGPLLKLYLMFKDEPLNWTIERQDLSDFLAKRDYRVLELADAQGLKERFLPPNCAETLHQGEFLALSEADPLS
ncbi:MAG: class I SAM-dependent methyltransferase [Magnetococcales bacterium]|nr:class I SAM-dependent methyltransferase [Magnetococcales bacterium]